MNQSPSQPSVVQARPQPNIYTILIIIAILALAVTVGVILRNLLSQPPVGYGLSFGDLFGPIEIPVR